MHLLAGRTVIVEPTGDGGSSTTDVRRDADVTVVATSRTFVPSAAHGSKSCTCHLERSMFNRKRPRRAEHPLNKHRPNVRLVDFRADGRRFDPCRARKELDLVDCFRIDQFAKVVASQAMPGAFFRSCTTRTSHVSRCGGCDGANPTGFHRSAIGTSPAMPTTYRITTASESGPMRNIRLRGRVTRPQT